MAHLDKRGNRAPPTGRRLKSPSLFFSSCFPLPKGRKCLSISPLRFCGFRLDSPPLAKGNVSSQNSDSALFGALSFHISNVEEREKRLFLQKRSPKPIKRVGKKKKFFQHPPSKLSDLKNASADIVFCGHFALSIL